MSDTAKPSAYDPTKVAPFRNNVQTMNAIRNQAIGNPVTTTAAAIALREKLEPNSDAFSVALDGRACGDEFAAWIACRALDFLIDECQDFLIEAAKRYRESLRAVPAPLPVPPTAPTTEAGERL